MRKTVGEFLQHTHPDKTLNQPSHIQLLFDEISKRLSSIYQEYKCKPAENTENDAIESEAEEE